MADIIVAGNTSGAITISAPLVAGSGVLTLPTGTDTLIGKATTDTLTNKTLTAPVLSGSLTGTYTLAGTPTTGASLITSGTAVASTSGTSIDFTGIPSWVKRITVMFSGVSTNGTSNLQVQVGNGSIVTTGYSGSCASGATVAGNASAFIFTVNIAGGSTVSGVAVIQSLNGLTYCQLGNSGGNSGNIVASSGGAVTLSSVLDRVRLTTVNGTDTFDVGSVNILYE